MTPLTEADAALGEVQGAAANLPAEGATALKTLVDGALPALQSTADRLLADTVNTSPILSRSSTASAPSRRARGVNGAAALGGAAFPVAPAWR